MKKLLTLSFILIPFLSLASDPIWVKDGSAYTVNGELTLKKSNGTSINTSLNKTLSTRKTLGRTPNIMVVGSGSYSWDYGFQMSDGTYYIYERELGLYVPFDADTFEKSFIYEEDAVLSITAEHSILVSVRGEFSGGMSCGSSNYSGSCSATCSSSHGSTSSSGSMCYGSYYEGFTGGYIEVSGGVDLLRQTETKFFFSVSVDVTALATFNIPASFSDALGGSVSAGSQKAWNVGTPCNDDEGTGNTCSRRSSTGATVAIYYYFTDDWHGSGLRVGGYDWDTSNNNTGKYVVGDAVADLPFGYLSGLRLTQSGYQMFAVNGGDLYGFKPGGTPKVVMPGVTSYPVKAVNITGTKSAP